MFGTDRLTNKTHCTRRGSHNKQRKKRVSPFISRGRRRTFFAYAQKEGKQSWGDSLAIALCDPIGVLGEGPPDSVPPRLPGEVQEVIIKCFKHVLLNEHVPAVANESFAQMLYLFQKCSDYIESQVDSMWHCLFWKACWHLMLLYNHPTQHQRSFAWHQ